MQTKQHTPQLASIRRATSLSRKAKEPFFAPQRKEIRVGNKHAHLEKEADHMADKVVNEKHGKIQKRPLFNQITPLVQRESEPGTLQAIPKEEYTGNKDSIEAESPVQQKSQTPDITQSQSIPNESSYTEHVTGETSENNTLHQRSMDDTHINEPVEEEPTVDQDVMKKEREGISLGEESNSEDSENPVLKKNTDTPQADSSHGKLEQNKESDIQKQSEGQNTAQEKSSNWKKGFRKVFKGLGKRLNSFRGKGKLLEGDTRSHMEKAFGADFSQVKIHSDAKAEKLSEDLQAQAFTYGMDIFFNKGKFDPHTKKGLHLLAHELTHTIQQGSVNKKNDWSQITDVTDYTKDITSSEQVSVEPTTVSTETSTDTDEATTEAPATVQGESPEIAEEELLNGEEKLAEDQEKSPATPEEDPAFQQMMEKVKNTQKKNRSHPTPDKKITQYREAAVVPTTEQKTKNDQGSHLEMIDQAATQNEEKKKGEPFTAGKFKSLFKEKLEELSEKLPKSESAAKRFKKEKPLSQLKDSVKSRLDEEKNKVVQPLPAQVKQGYTPESGLPAQDPNKHLTKDPAGKAPQPIDKAAASPKPMHDSEISMDKESHSLDELMEKNKITEEQLAKSEEPQFLHALKAKKDAQQEAKAAPGRYREGEKKTLEQAQNQAYTQGQKRLGASHEKQKTVFGGVYDQQSDTEKKDETKQSETYRKLDEIYNKTKDKVDYHLDGLSTIVNDTFNQEAEAAKKEFEKNVESQLEDIYGWTKIDDWLFGEDTEAIEKVFDREKSEFLKAIDKTLEKIANYVAEWLNVAIAWVRWGRNESQKLFDNLSEDQKNKEKGAFDFFMTQYDVLEDTVRDHEKMLAENLVESYQKSVASLRESFDKIKSEVSKGWIQKAAEFVGDVAKAIYRLGKLLANVFRRISHLISQILADPKQFFQNLSRGIKQGFKKFRDNIDTYLLTAFFDWLRGKVKGEGIKVPEKFDAAGIFDLFAQLLNITWEGFLEIARKVFGKKTVAFFLKGAEIAGKAFEFAKNIFSLFKIVKEEGIGGLWKHIKEMIFSKLDEIIKKVREIVFYETIKKALIWIAGLFNPIGAFIKIVQLVYKAMKWLVDNIDRIEQLLNSVVDSVELAISGNISGIVDKVINAVRGFIVMAIDFLAKLLGLGDLAKKIRQIINAIRNPIIRAIEWLLKKLKPTVLKVERMIRQGISKGTKIYQKGKAKVKKGVKKIKEKIVEWWKARHNFKTKKGSSHSVYFKKEGTQASLFVKSKPKTYDSFIQSITPANEEQMEAKKQANFIAKKIDLEKKRYPPKDFSNENKNLFFKEKKNNIKLLLEKISQPLSVLLETEHLPDGTYQNPIPIRWTKRGLVNEMYDFNPIPERWTKHNMMPPHPVEKASYKEQTKIEIPPTMWKTKFKEEREGIRDDQKIKYIVIGVDPGNLPKIEGKPIKRGGTRQDKEKDRLRNTLLPNYNISIGDYHMDHVKDLGWGGQDTISNLWPLEPGMNTKWGNEVYNQVVSYSDENGKPKIDKPKNLRGKWFIIDSIGDL